MAREPEKAVISERPPLTDAAKRALAEAEARRAQRAEEEAALEKARLSEQGGPKTIEPTRYGDWERKGIAYDF